MPQFGKFVVSLTIFNDKPLLMIVNGGPLFTMVNIIVNNIFFAKTIVFSKAIAFLKKNNCISRKSVFKNDLFQKRSLFVF